MNREEAKEELRRLAAAYKIDKILTATIDAWDSSEGRRYRTHLFAIDRDGLDKGSAASAKIALTRLVARSFDYELEGGALVVRDSYDPVYDFARLVAGDAYAQIRHEELIP